MLFKLSNVNSILALILGYLKQALNNSALVGERHCESKVSYPRTQHNVPGLRAQAQIARSGVQCTKHEALVCQQQKDGMLRLW